MANACKVTGLYIQRQSQQLTNRALVGSWSFNTKSYKHLDYYKVEWKSWSGKYKKDKKTMIWDIKESHIKQTNSTFTPGNDVLYVVLTVKPVSKKHQNKKGKQVSYWSAAYVSTKAFSIPLYVPPTVGGPAISLKQAGTQGRVLEASWSWSKAYTSGFEVEWGFQYTYNGAWHLSTSTVAADARATTYTADENAYQVQVRIKPKCDSGAIAPWEGAWSGYAYFKTEKFRPDVAPTPTISINKYQLSMSVNITHSTATKVRFEIVQDNQSKPYETKDVNLSSNYAGYTKNVPAGHQYKVRALAGNNYNLWSYAWSEYSSNVFSAPAAPGAFSKCAALTETSVELKWGQSLYADNYTVEYTNVKNYFDSSPSNVQSVTVTSTTAIITGLESETGDNIWYFRCKATKDNQDSGWNDVKSVTLGRKPTPPTTWSLTTTVAIGETIKLYWIHNSRDNSSQQYAQIETTINGSTTVTTIDTRSTPSDEKDHTQERDISTSSMSDGTVIKWRVRTKGINPSYSDWSVMRTIKVFAPSTIHFNYGDDGFPTEVTTLPLPVRCEAGPATKEALRYNITIIPQTSYEYEDIDGTIKNITAGEDLYTFTVFPNTSDPNHLVKDLGVTDITLMDSIEYTLRCSVVMNTGLPATCEQNFTVYWAEVDMNPNAETALDEANLTINIRPYCLNEEDELRTDVYLYVYRRNFDGTFTAIESALDAADDLTIVDPHPSLDLPRYRIVSRYKVSGQTAYFDISTEEFDEKCIIIQWDEAYQSFFDYDRVEPDETATEPEDNDSVTDQIDYTGSIVKLPYNIDVTDNHASDVEFVEYIGREHPVSYYGTQKGETSTWSTVIPADDDETLYALRRLAVWMGDAYVREPSGSGYWAHVGVSIAQKHRETTIPITLTLTRVEGGA